MLVGDVRWAIVRCRADLDVVGRQEMVLVAAEGLEVRPRLLRDVAADTRRPRRDGAARRRGVGRLRANAIHGAATQSAENRRETGRADRTQRRDERRGPPAPAADWPLMPPRKARSRTVPAARRAGRRRFPLEQAAARDAETDERDDDRVQPFPGLVGHERELQPGARRVRFEVLGRRAHEAAPRLLAAAARAAADERGAGRGNRSAARAMAVHASG